MAPDCQLIQLDCFIVNRIIPKNFNWILWPGSEFAGRHGGECLSSAMRSHLRKLLTQAIEKTAKDGELNIAELPALHLEPPKQREFGDLSSNVAMLWAKSVKKNPRAIAEAILKNIDDPDGIAGASRRSLGRDF